MRVLGCVYWLDTMGGGLCWLLSSVLQWSSWVSGCYEGRGVTITGSPIFLPVSLLKRMLAVNGTSHLAAPGWLSHGTAGYLALFLPKGRFLVAGRRRSFLPLEVDYCWPLVHNAIQCGHFIVLEHTPQFHGVSANKLWGPGEYHGIQEDGALW